MNDPRPSPRLVVGIGASAGGLDPCRELLSRVPPDSGMAFVVVLHLDPSRESHLPEILRAHTSLEVVQVNDPVRIEPDHVYVIAPNTSLEIADGNIVPGGFEQPHGRRRPIDLLFSSLAAAHGDAVAAIVLSGTGSDGSRGLVDVHEAGGLCIAQAPDTAQQPGMPSAAIATGLVSVTLAPDAIPGFLLAHAEHPGGTSALLQAGGAHAGASPAAEPESAFERVLDLLAERFGFDWHAYKEGTLRRRSERRLGLLPVSAWQEYLEYLRKHPDELAALYRDVLIGVTQFFRDPEHWQYLQNEIIPRLLEGHVDPRSPIRIWSAGCATGEEAYGLAIALLEQLGSDQPAARLQIFATDVSHEALLFARRGLYAPDIAEHISPERLERFFEREGDSYRVRQKVREHVTFAPHNLLAEPPFSRIDLVSCRNLFIYLQPQAQEESLERLHFALRPGGVLWLGSSETVTRQSRLFSPISPKHHFYRRCEAPRARGLPWTTRAPYPSGIAPLSRGGPVDPRSTVSLSRMIEQLVLERYALACVVINQAGNVLHLFGPTEDYLAQPKGELRPDLLSWVRPALYARLRPALRSAVEERKSITISDAQVQRDGGTVRVECTIQPISSIADGLFLVVFRDLPPATPEGATLPLAVAEDEPLVGQLTRQLQDTQAELQGTIEELDSAYEEYRASYEELVSLNEELQSSNEELEATKEEAQSVNEELLTVNRELEERHSTLRSVNADLENLLALTTIPTIFLDRELRIRRFTPAAERLMWLVPTDVGRPLEHIKKRVTDDKLLDDAAGVLGTLVPIEREVRSDDGRWYLRKIVPFRNEDRIDGVCVIFYDITTQKLATEAGEESRHFAEAIVRTARSPLVVLDELLTVVSANESFCETFEVEWQDMVGGKLFEFADGAFDIPALRELLDRVVLEKRATISAEIEHSFEATDTRSLRLNASLMERPGRASLVLLSIEDVTPLREAQTAAQRRAQELEQEHRRKDEFLAMLGHELRNPLGALANGLTLLSALKDDPVRSEKTRAMLVRQTRRIAGLLDQLLDVSRVISGKIEIAHDPVDVVEVCMGAVEAVRPTMGRIVDGFSMSLPEPGAIFVEGDALRLTQVVENLLTNAAKYTDPGGQIWLTVEATGDQIEVRVRDTGIGMPPELLPHVFEIFTQGPQRLDRAKGGLGLGLPLVRLLVGMHGGRVHASSAGPGKGSEFVVVLPRMRTADAVVRDPDATADIDAPAAGGRRILVVDDEVDAAHALVQLLGMRGHDAREAHDGPAALEAARELRPEIVLLDLGLPEMDGYEVAARLRDEHGPKLRIVALTGYQRDAERLATAGFDDHIIKPATTEKLSRVLTSDE